MRFVIKQGKDGLYRPVLTGANGKGMMIPCYGFDTPGMAANYAIQVITACQKAEVLTADGNRWVF